jgi:hypothetical protein
MNFLDVIHPAAKTNIQLNGFYFGSLGLFYVATPKAACTTLKWWYARALGIDEKILADNSSSETSMDLKIHDLFGKHAPEVNFLDWNSICQILSDERVYKFALTRNPYTRIFSAWQSKWLLCEPLQTERYRGSAIFKPNVNSIGDLAESFEIFLEYLYSKEYPNIRDLHVVPQVDLLGYDFIQYNNVVNIEDSYNFLDKMSTKWGSQYPHPLSGPRHNEGVFPFASEFITTRSEQLIKLIYSRDFDRFGYPIEMPQRRLLLNHEAIGLTLKNIKLTVEKNQRFGELLKRLDRL